jgi:hypothetical protein
MHEDIRAIRCPTLVLVGEADRGTDITMARTLHERIAGSELAVLPPGGPLLVRRGGRRLRPRAPRPPRAGLRPAPSGAGHGGEDRSAVIATLGYLAGMRS